MSSDKFEHEQQVEEASGRKPGFVQIEETSPKPGFGQKVKRHCARFWWVHLIIFCVVFLIVALCLVYVGMPKIAQHDVDRSSLEFTDLKYLEPTPNSLLLSQVATLWNPSKFTPSLDAFNVSFFVGVNGVASGDRVNQILLPAIHATKPSSQVIIDNQTLSIESVDQLGVFATQVLTQEYVEMVFDGKTNLHLGKLPTVGVDYYEVSRPKGLNGLKGFNVTDARVNTSVPAGTPNMRGIAFIPNPSVMTIAMGNVTLTLSTESQGVVGNSTIENMTLKPGNNSLPMTAIIDQTKLVSSLKDGKVDLKIVGKTSIYNGEHLTYYETALASNELILNLNVLQILADSQAES